MSSGDGGELLSEEFLTGRVEFWEASREFGFILVDSGQNAPARDVHVSLGAVQRCLKRESLKEGERLRFRIRSYAGKRRPTAWDLEEEGEADWRAYASA